MFCQMSPTSLGYQDKKLPTCNAGDEVLEGRAWCQTPSDHTREQSFQTSDFRQLAGHRGILACCEQCDNAGWCWSIVLWLDKFHIWNQRANLMIKFVNIQEIQHSAFQYPHRLSVSWEISLGFDGLVESFWSHPVLGRKPRSMWCLQIRASAMWWLKSSWRMRPLWFLDDSQLSILEFRPWDEWVWMTCKSLFGVCV